ncbi:hypothetical protein [Mycolicibacterium conceptionense]|uniref:Uncharacterized protein n=1 Tax=Mycolicibacterium conceptionense TaxID=451644 RepID=A0A1A1X5I6_9MYCO|nr:hypothetical protein [Mycolicibacterium conceptionense]OBF14419.1 hypothetical protein A5726_24990 [Mycolicibacterium conceptionense]OBF31689.1 hypothetical protein A5720_28055 [Mycolicibacterium conceptionense]OBH97037.1 hypothetical protein A5716_16870 [Mycolicibacterium conceptionense]
MSDAQKLIAQVLQQHHFVTELQFDGTKLYHCEKCCGTKVCVAHSVEEYRAHLAAEINKALGELTRAWAAVLPDDSYFGPYHESHEVLPGDARDQALVDVAEYEDATLRSRWVSGWSEVQP